MMERRGFLHQCVALPAVAASWISVKRAPWSDNPRPRDYCLDGTFSEFELIIGHDLQFFFLERKQLLETFCSRIKQLRSRLNDSGKTLPPLWIHHRRDVPSAREYRFVVFGVEVDTCTLREDFPMPGEMDLQAIHRQLGQIYSEVEKIAVRHQYVWNLLNQPSLVELDPATGMSLVRN